MSELLETALEQPKLFEAITKKARALRGTVPNLWLTVEDLAQAGWIAASESVDYFDPKHDVDIFDFLVMQAKHAMNDMIKKEVRRQKENNKYGVEIVYSTTVAEDGQTGWYDMTAFENQLDALTLLEMLPDDRARDIMQLHLSGCTQEEIAEEVNLERSYVSRLITDYFTFYRNQLGDEELSLLRIEGQDVCRASEVEVIRPWNNGFYGA